MERTLFTKHGSSTGASATDGDDNEQSDSSETTDEDDEEPIPLRSEVELGEKQLKSGKATGCDDISSEMIKRIGNIFTTQTDCKNMANRRMARGLETSSTYPYTKER